MPARRHFEGVGYCRTANRNRKIGVREQYFLICDVFTGFLLDSIFAWPAGDTRANTAVECGFDLVLELL
jgi:hypothetical protein